MSEEGWDIEWVQNCHAGYLTSSPMYIKNLKLNLPSYLQAVQ